MSLFLDVTEFTTQYKCNNNLSFKKIISHWSSARSLIYCMLYSSDRSVVNLDLDGIVQVLDRHLHDSSTGMMTRIAVLKWLYHLYIKTPRKVSSNVILNMQFQIILKHAMLKWFIQLYVHARCSSTQIVCSPCYWRHYQTSLMK